MFEHLVLKVLCVQAFFFSEPGSRDPGDSVAPRPAIALPSGIRLGLQLLAGQFSILACLPAMPARARPAGLAGSS